MNRSPFWLAASTFDHARKFQLRVKRLAPHPPVEGLLSETHAWHQALRDADDDLARVLRVFVWRLRVAVLYGLAAFDSSALEINHLAQTIAGKGQSFPDLRERCDRINKLAGNLVQDAYNPKREAVRAELARHAGEGKNIGLIVALTRNHLPGFTEELINDFEAIGKGIQFVTSRRQLLASTFDHVVVPFGTRQCGLADELIHGYRAPSATVVAYRKETMASHRQIELPCTITATQPIPAAQPDEYVEMSEDEERDTETRDVFWKFIKQAETAVIEESEVNDTTHVVSARGILLANGAHVFLKDDSKAIEISDVVEGRRSLDEYGVRVPRTAVKELQPGNLIVLRVKGSGAYLVEVADDLMKKDGAAGLRGRATGWKPLLEEVLKERGSKWFYRQLEKRGYHLASSHRYLWKWTTNDVISPRSDQHFFETIAILDDLGRTLGERDVLKGAQMRWEEMKELKLYHLKASQRIRKNLLRRLRSIIKSQPRIGSEYTLRIPGVSAGTMAIVRIASVDTEVVLIPHHRVGVVYRAGTEAV